MEATPPPPTVQYRHIIKLGTLIGDEMLTMALRKLKTNHDINAMDPHFYILSLANEWKHSRQYFKPEEPNAWNYNNRATPISSHEPLIIPILCTYNKESINNHCIMAAIFENKETQAD